MRFSARIAGERLYADFLMPSRLGDYERLLRTFLEAGYAVTSVEGLVQLMTSRGPRPSRLLVLRHDVDTDPATAAAMWQIERRLRISGSYFFRLSTVDVALMQAIAGSGSDASYHYEELAAVAKRHRLRTAEQVQPFMAEAQADFRRNITLLRESVGLPMRVVASHGDFVNRRLRMPNWTLLADPAFRRSVDIEAEVYDPSLMEPVTSRHSDTLYPRYWVPEDPIKACDRGEPMVYLLVHPRHWRVARGVNLRDDLRRLAEGLDAIRPGRPR